MRLVIIESPYAGEVERNLCYARRAMRDSITRGEAPLASHLLYTQEGILDDTVKQERALGMDAGYAWMGVLRDAVLFGHEVGVVAYEDYGVSHGMETGLVVAKALGLPIERRLIGENP